MTSDALLLFTIVSCASNSTVLSTLHSCLSVQRVKEAIATESKQADILRAHFALVDLNSRAAAEEAEANRRFKQLERVAIDGRRNPATRKIQRWYRSILTVRYAEKKKTTKAVKGKPKKK